MPEPDMEKVIKGLEEISYYFLDIYRKEKNGYSIEQEYCNVAEEALALIQEQKRQLDEYHKADVLKKNRIPYSPYSNVQWT